MYIMGTRLLLVSPKTFKYHGWNYTQKLTKKNLIPPIAMLTVAGLIPKEYELELVDENRRDLTDEHIAWADAVLMTGLTANKFYIEAAAKRCREAGKPVILGGCHATLYEDEIDYVDSVVIGEAELVMPQLLQDIDNDCLEPIYRADGFNDMATNPPPFQRFDLINFDDYMQQQMQFSKGCVFSCEFCDVAYTMGPKQRAKTPERFVAELENLYSLGYRGIVNISDENLITAAGVKRLLEQVRDWQRERDYPFSLYAYGISINLAFNDNLMDLAIEAGLTTIFIGIETPIKESLLESMKLHNVKRAMLESIHKLQAKGFTVVAGFVVGFDYDPHNVSELLIDFIREANLPALTLNFLQALKGSPLYHRLKKEGRYLEGMDFSYSEDAYWNGFGGVSDLNFIPKMGHDELIENYVRVGLTVFNERNYFDRCSTFLDQWNKPKVGYQEKRYGEIAGILGRFVKSIFFTRYNVELFRFLAKTAIRCPSKFLQALLLGMGGYSYIVERDEIRRVFEKYIPADLDVRETHLPKIPVAQRALGK